MEFEIFSLSNGIQVIHQRKSGDAAHFGLFVDVGSRDETETETGLAHMLEHCMFKGTTNRKAFHILNRLDNIGGELNAYTTKEETSIHSSFLKQYYERAIELTFDIAFNPTFPEKEIAREKLIILDEFYAYKENPSDQIFEDFDQIVFPNHSLGRTILGEPKHIKKAKRSHLTSFHTDYYHPENMVFASVGDISATQLKKWLEKHLPVKEFAGKKVSRIAPTEYFQVEKIVKKQVHQAHIVIGNQAYAYSHPKKRSLILLNNILGGPSLNNRLNLNISEKHGFAYHLESNYSGFSDSGEFSIYMGTDHKQLDKSVELIYKELDKLKTKKLGTLQLNQAKQQIKGQIALGHENGLNIMLALGKSLLTYGKVDLMDDIYHQIDQISSSDLLDVANDIFDTNKLSSLIYVPKNH
ncbi:MAG: putative Zn-dependent peptidase [Salibacteraceae bacterium]|jgi:predicted Zn-dependent peptidase